MQLPENVALAQIVLSVVLLPVLVFAVITIAILAFATVIAELVSNGFSFINDYLFKFVDWFNERIP